MDLILAREGLEEVSAGAVHDAGPALPREREENATGEANAIEDVEEDGGGLGRAASRRPMHAYGSDALPLATDPPADEAPEGGTHLGETGKE